MGEYLRHQLKEVLGQSNIVKVNERRLEGQLQALERIANDTYLKQYPRKKTTSATGLTAEQLKQIRSEEFQRYLSEEFSQPSRFSWFSKKKVQPQQQQQQQQQ